MGRNHRLIIKNRFKQDGQDRQDKEEMMKAAMGNDEREAACLSFSIHHSSFSIAFILSILSILLILKWLEEDSTRRRAILILIG
jgi:hypothetical protein